MIWSWWMTLFVIFAVLILIGCIPVGADIRYSQDGLFLAVKVSALKIQLLPKKKKSSKKKEKKQADKGNKKEDSIPTDAKEQRVEEKEKSSFLSGGISDVFELLDILDDTLGNLRRKLRLNLLKLHIRFGGGDDPAKAAVKYGRAWAVAGAITPRLEHWFVIKKRDIQPILDYNEKEMKIDARLVLTITIGRILGLALRAGVKFLKFIAKKKLTDKGENKNEPSSI